LIGCDACNDLVPRGIVHECPEAIEECYLKPIGCLFRGNRKALVNHHKESRDLHLKLAKLLGHEQVDDVKRLTLKEFWSERGFLPVIPQHSFQFNRSVYTAEEGWMTVGIRLSAFVLEKKDYGNAFYLKLGPGYCGSPFFNVFGGRKIRDGGELQDTNIYDFRIAYNIGHRTLCISPADKREYDRLWLEVNHLRN
jgi:hypothetical protein